MDYFYWNETTESEEIWTVYYAISPIIPARTWGHPDDWHEAEGGELEMLTVWKGKEDITAQLSEEDQQKVEDACYEDQQKQLEDYNF